ncbi:hypothetical protein COL154_013286 [Colletotrichum chrysophilum]|uniref:uncharacterized protein n=1 Tax=Colletotrichum chrysophilum TaxID=1836956 RepID=UPI002301905B|nr:uncharacterized protein COL26b_010710 [Colletotrichum chrysophilum]KAJ0336794.1 hypothetical protein KNSL1_013163 [Colletotrichum chrysophilum]KAJ0350430.1 hypothetical protein COL154_013286 [Colletotrichum chrysophilum]KAJ0368823.1 hypothetical protein COL26b_010710 [Colletotrichum chrysophilum]
MIMKIFIQATVIVAAVTAAHVPVRRADIPNGFHLWANMTYPDLPPEFGPDVQGQELSYVSKADCLAEIVLAPAGQGSIFRTNDDTVGVAHLGDESSPSAGMVITPGGTATVPSPNTVELSCSGGTHGVIVTADGLGYPKEASPNGGFMACKRENAVALSFFRAGQRPLLGCSVVQLLPIY